MKILITIPDEKYHYIKELERGNTDYATTLMLYHAVKYGKPFERPQGEWIKIGKIGLAYKCNKCDEVSVIPENFCPNCGATMETTL